MKATILNEVKNISEVLRVSEANQCIDGVNEFGAFTFDIEVEGEIESTPADKSVGFRGYDSYNAHALQILRIWDNEEEEPIYLDQEALKEIEKALFEALTFEMVE